MGALILAAMNDLAGALVHAFAIGSSPAIALPDPPPTPGLMLCPKCGTLQQPRVHGFAVHFASNTEMRPCAGSWAR